MIHKSMSIKYEPLRHRAWSNLADSRRRASFQPHVLSVQRPQVFSVQRPHVLSVQRPHLLSVQRPQLLSVQRSHAWSVQRPQVFSVQRRCLKRRSASPSVERSATSGPFWQNSRSLASCQTQACFFCSFLSLQVLRSLSLKLSAATSDPRSLP